MRKNEIFISYARVDKERALELEAALENSGLGFDVFCDIRKIDAGDEFRNEIEKAIAECTYMVVIVTPNISESGWVAYEVGQAKALKKKIIPWVPGAAQIKDLKLPEFLPELNATADIAEVLKGMAVLTDPIVVVGSASVEYVIKLDGDETIALDAKHVADVEERVGGSGVNYATRLLANGRDILPILPVANDTQGQKIQQELVRMSEQGSVSATARSFLTSDRFFSSNGDFKSQTSFVVVDKSAKRRTIFSERIGGRGNKNYARSITDHLRERLDELARIFTEQGTQFPNSVLIGHIQADSRDLGATKNMECTRMLLDRFADNSLIYANFGRSQYELGIEELGELLQRVDVLQLNFEEAKKFFAKESLAEIVESLKDHHITTVITLERFGAIGVHKDNKNVVYVTWPSLRAREIVDTTGSGDAFASAMVSELRGKKRFSADTFSESLKAAAAWAAYSCQSFGGAGRCPGKSELEQLKGAVSERFGERLDEILRILDIAFD